MFPLNAANLLGKDLAVGINSLEGTGPEWLMPKRNLFSFLGRE